MEQAQLNKIFDDIICKYEIESKGFFLSFDDMYHIDQAALVGALIEYQDGDAYDCLFQPNTTIKGDYIMTTILAMMADPCELTELDVGEVIRECAILRYKDMVQNVIDERMRDLIVILSYEPIFDKDTGEVIRYKKSPLYTNHRIEQRI